MIKTRFFTQRQVLGIFLAIVTLLLVACDAGGGTTPTDPTGSGTPTDPTGSGTPIEGTFSYSDIVTPLGTEAEGTLTWGVAPLSGQTVEYSIALADGSSVDNSEITIDANGKIVVSSTATKSSFDSLYKVTATGTGSYEGTIEAEINIWVKSQSVYTPMNIVEVSYTTFSYPHSPSTLPTSTFVLKEATDGLDVDPDNGEVTVNSLRLRTGTYVIVITEGSLKYAVELGVTVQVQPTTKNQLQAIVEKAIDVDGANNRTVDLNFIDTSIVTDMESIFGHFTDFNGDVSEWKTDNVTNMSGMFGGATAFNGDISKWKTGKVTDMSDMFASATAFNGDISGWTVSNVTNMSSMFKNASAFNQGISGWTVSSVTDMSLMFQYAERFNQDIDAWNVASSVTKTNMFVGSRLANNPPNWYPTTP